MTVIVWTSRPCVFDRSPIAAISSSADFINNNRAKSALYCTVVIDYNIGPSCSSNLSRDITPVSGVNCRSIFRNLSLIIFTLLVLVNFNTFVLFRIKYLPHFLTAQSRIRSLFPNGNTALLFITKNNPSRN